MKQKLIKIAKWVFNLLKRIFKAIFIHEKACCKSILLFMVILTIQNIFAQKTVHYDLHIKDTIVTFGGKEKRGIAVNGQIPMPTLTFTEGDTAEIFVYNDQKKIVEMQLPDGFLEIF